MRVSLGPPLQVMHVFRISRAVFEKNSYARTRKYGQQFLQDAQYRLRVCAANSLGNTHTRGIVG